MGYGFSLPENPADHFALGFSSTIAAYIDDVKLRRYGELGDTEPEMTQGLRHETTKETNIHWVRVQKGVPEFSPDFLEEFSIAIENPRERRKNEKSLRSSLNLMDRSLSRNKLHVLSAVFMILQKGQSAIRKHDHSLPGNPQNSRQVDAARYRQNQLYILDQVLLALAGRISSLYETNSEYCREFRIVRLEDILIESPKRLQKDLRSVLNVGLKTRDPVKIKERGGIDFAFTVWLCGLSIVNRENRGKHEPFEPSSNFNERCSRWLDHLQKLYTQEESEVPTDKDYSAAVVKDDRAAWFDPVRNSISEEGGMADSTSTVTSYLDAIRSCIKKHPQSLYNKAELSLTHLAWCYNVIRNEGVWVPNVRDREGDDEWVLFLDS